MSVEVKIKRTTKKRLIPKELKLHGKMRVQVGFPAERVSQDIIERAIFNEFGTTRIPERPFMRNAINGNRHAYLTLMGRYGAKMRRGEMTLQQALDLLGAKGVGDIQESIRSNTPPPNAPSTVARKGSASTLIDTGDMRKAVTYWIEE